MRRTPWWELEGHALASRVWDTFGELKERDQDRFQHNVNMLRHYMNRGAVTTPAGSDLSVSYAGKNFNVTKSVVDTAATKIAKLDPVATFVTSGGDRSLRRRAENLSRYVEGQRQRLGVESKKEQLVKDAELFGTGVWHVFENGGQLRLERVFVNELLVDHQEAFYRKPRTLLRHKRLPREMLQAMWPEKADLIEDVAAASGNDYSDPSQLEATDGSSCTTDMVEVVEAWHLPSGKDSGDGRHVICLEHILLEDDEYARETFPFIFFHWDEPPVGFWGTGIVEQVFPIDQHVNQMLSRIAESLERGSVPMVFVDEDSLQNPEGMNNGIANIYQMRTGTRDPRFVVPNTVSGELLNHLERRINQAFEASGVSQLSAQAKKPSGLDAAVALREFNDIESERFIMQSKRFELAVSVELAEHIVELSKELAQRPDTDKSALTINAVNGRSLLQIDWSDVDLQRDAYVIQIFPTSALPNHPAARRQEVQEMLQAGMIGAEEGRELLDFPDLQAFNDRKLAAQHLIDQIIENLLEGRPAPAPEPYFPLQVALPRFQEAYMQAKLESVPEERLADLRRWMIQAQQLQQRAIAAAAPPQPAGLPEQAVPAGAPGGAALPVGIPQ